ncbi:hypothetical protein L226DRAFT_530252 [Lentinus tigrinus ALCF2SS1-7]|uniref:uncharacterized protein n=1 Tax=Lentinus tigrinus ALCF2SS1-7 TaxID=1328758 RepID=UPI001165F2BC|nr:hypothetical protein L226DRAFT_530841 [Lentinus tigrinus ALCF2SS1-7]RPD80059.1 hypothetical protein L226DRAFT_530252 [Lentinus tigrinus ALCF2SS1-7]
MRPKSPSTPEARSIRSDADGHGGGPEGGWARTHCGILRTSAVAEDTWVLSTRR